MLGFLRAILCPIGPCLWFLGVPHSSCSTLGLFSHLSSSASLPRSVSFCPWPGCTLLPLLSIFYPSCLPLWLLSVFSSSLSLPCLFPLSCTSLCPTVPPLTSDSPDAQDGCLGPTTQTLQASASPQSSSQPSWSVKSRQHMPNIFLSASSSPVFPKFLPESTGNGEQARPRQSPSAPSQALHALVHDLGNSLPF